MDKYTGIKDLERDGEETREVYITTDENEFNTNLFDFCNNKCKEKCDQSWDIHDIFGGFECSDCSIARKEKSGMPEWKAYYDILRFKMQILFSKIKK